MAVARSHQFNPNLDPELLRSIEALAGSYKPYKVELRSGYRPGDKRFHGQGQALDVQLYDPKTGAALDSYQGGGAAEAYQQFANAWYQSLTPEQQAKARWGGYFGDPTDPTYGKKYGDQDYMHFDFGRSASTGMLGGDWGTGFKPEAVKALGLAGAGGIEALDAQMQAAGYTPEQRRNAIASIESQGSGDYAAIGPEADPAGHRALGRYQVMDYNLQPWAKQYLGMEGLDKDAFVKDPQLQDKLFDAVMNDYVKKYGEEGAAQAWFGGPGSVGKGGAGKDVLGTSGNEYVKKYMAALTGTPKAGHPRNPQVGTGGYVAPGANTTQVPAAKDTAVAGKDWAKSLAGAAKGFGESMKAPVLGEGGRAPQLPSQAPMQQPALPMIAESMADENRRNQLAALMQQYWI